MDDNGTLDHFLEEIDAAAEVMCRQAANPVLATPAYAQPHENGPVEDLLALLDQLIELLEFKEVVLAGHTEVWTSPRTAGEDPRLLGSQLDRLRARRHFWEGLRTARSGPLSVDGDAR